MQLWRHLYKDGFAMPLSSLLASKIPYVLGGAIIVEQVFNWPGMGRLAWQAAARPGLPVLLGITLVAALIVRLGHMLKEAVQVGVNPRLAEAGRDPEIMSTYVEVASEPHVLGAHTSTPEGKDHRRRLWYFRSGGHYPRLSFLARRLPPRRPGFNGSRGDERASQPPASPGNGLRRP